LTGVMTIGGYDPLTVGDGDRSYRQPLWRHSFSPRLPSLGENGVAWM
jgi:hypothetical protein